MSQETRYFRVGLFVLGGIALAVAVIIIVGGGLLLRPPLVVETYFEESVQGLEVGSPVRLRGVRLGSVSSIGFVRDEYQFDDPELRLREGNLVLVRMQIEQRRPGQAFPDSEARFRHLVAQGLRLRLTPLGITGTSFLQADFLDAERFPPREISFEPHYLYVPSAPSTITQLSSAAERIMARIDQLDIEELLTNFDKLLVNVNQVVEDAEVKSLQEAAESLLADATRTSRDVRRALAALEPDAVGTELRQTLQETQITLADLRDLVDRNSEDFEAAIDNLRVASQNLRTLSDTLRSQPSLLLFGGPPTPVEERVE